MKRNRESNESKKRQVAVIPREKKRKTDIFQKVLRSRIEITETKLKLLKDAKIEEIEFFKRLN